jgi:hypothetical protein
VDRRIILKSILEKKVMRRCGMDAPAPRHDSVGGSCEHVNKLRVSYRQGKFLDHQLQEGLAPQGRSKWEEILLRKLKPGLTKQDASIIIILTCIRKAPGLNFGLIPKILNVFRVFSQTLRVTVGISI